MPRVVVSLALLLLAACQTAMHQVAGSKDDAFGRAFIDSLHAGAKRNLHYLLSPRLARIPGVADSLEQVAKSLPSGAIESDKLIGVIAFKRAEGASYYGMTYELHASGGSAIVRLIVADELGHSFVDGVTVHPLSASIIARTAFTSANASAGGVVALLLAGALMLFCVVTAVRVLRSHMPRSALWALASLIGIGGLAVPWSGGAVGFQWMSIYLLSATFSHGEIGSPWYILLSCPLGALIAESRRRQHLQRDDWWATVLPWRGLSFGWVGRLFVPLTDPATIPKSSRQFVAGVEILGGIGGVGVTLYNWHAPTHPPDADLWRSVVLSLFTIAAGSLLWRGTRFGLGASRLLQGLQILKVMTPQFGFGLTAGPEFMFAFVEPQHSVTMSLSAYFYLWLNNPAVTARAVFVNVLPIFWLTMLFARWQQPMDNIESDVTPRTSKPEHAAIDVSVEAPTA